MKAFSRNILATGLILASLIVSGCNRDSETYTGPIEGWTDIVVPAEAEWTQSRLGGVENHHYSLSGWTHDEFFNYIENEMDEQEWLLNRSGNSERQFIKDGDNVTYNVNPVKDDSFSFVIIIEPDGIYGDSEE
jgi:hypothetical protein